MTPCSLLARRNSSVARETRLTAVRSSKGCSSKVSTKRYQTAGTSSALSFKAAHEWHHCTCFDPQGLLPQYLAPAYRLLLSLSIAHVNSFSYCLEMLVSCALYTVAISALRACRRRVVSIAFRTQVDVSDLSPDTCYEAEVYFSASGSSLATSNESATAYATFNTAPRPSVMRAVRATPLELCFFASWLGRRKGECGTRVL